MNDKADIDRAAVKILERDTFGRIAMIDEERKNFCAYLRKLAGIRSDGAAKAYSEAADEIERLVKELEEEKKKPKLRFRYEESRPFVIEE